MKEHMNTIEDFKRYSTSCFIPEYFRNYVNSLDNDNLQWFYKEVNNVLNILKDENYFIYKFQWIRMKEFKDLTKEIYLQFLYNPEGIRFDIFKMGWEEKLADKYQHDMDVLRYYRCS